MPPGGRWALDPDIVYLNHGSFGACPVPVLEAQAAWRDRLERRPVAFLARELEAALDRARETVATFLNANPDGLAFLPNATTGISTVLRSLRFAPGDELLATDHEYNATLNALRRIADRDGAQVVLAEVPFPIATPDQAVQAVLGAATARTRLALISHVTSPTALVMPIRRIVRELDARGIDTLVDAAHAPGMVDVDVDALGATYWVADGHKWLCGPKGSAVLWVRADRRQRIEPLVVSHGWNDARSERGERSPFRLRFDWQGTFDPTPFLALGDALGIVAALEAGGWPAIIAANHALVVEGRRRVAAAIAAELPAPDEMIGSMAALPLPGAASDVDARAIHDALVREGIELPVHGWPVPAARVADAGPRRVLLRLSAQRYNAPSDFDALAGALPGALSRVVG